MSTRILYRSAVEFVEASISADVQLDTQTVTLSLDGGTTWVAATWQGSPGFTRTARTSTPVTVSTALPTPGIYTLLARIADNTETTVVHAGGIDVR